MNSKKVAETIQQEREWAKAEYEAKTKGLNFTKDFHTRQEALMRDPLATVGERVMAWILRRSWGEYRLYALKNDGEPAHQSDCARDLEIDKRRVSNAVAYYQKRGYLEKREKLLYPVISPVLASPPSDDEEKSGEYRTFLEEWKVAYSSDFEEEKVLRSRLKEIVKVRLSLYKKSKTPPKSAAASLLEIKRDKIESPSSSSAVDSSRDIRENRANRAEEEDGRSLYERFKAGYPAAHFDEGKAQSSFEGKTLTQQAHILERLAVYLACDRWKDEDGRWIPLASTWLKSYDADPPPLIKKAPAKKGFTEGAMEEVQRRLAKYGRI
jgi:hypothetical protein